MYRRIKKAALYLFKLVGLFRLARLLTRRGLRILCYHGLSLNDEHLFIPGMFMTAETFRRRMDLLVREGYPVLPLDEALSRLENNSLPPGAVVITFDDGFYSTYKEAVPILRQRALPATIYVTTYYCVKESPVFRLLVPYLFWKTSVRQLDLTGLGLPVTGEVPVHDAHSSKKVAWEIIDYAESQLQENERCRLASALAERMELAYEPIVAGRGLAMMNQEELRDAAASGIDLQLHTHRHRLPEDAPSARREIQQNRGVLEPLVTKPLAHLCYPSGEWSEKHFAPLADEGILSATTCDTGFNYSDTPRFALSRFLDAEYISDIEFEAELCGITEVLRSIRSALRRHSRK